MHGKNNSLLLILLSSMSGGTIFGSTKVLLHILSILVLRLFTKRTLFGNISILTIDDG